MIDNREFKFAVYYVNAKPLRHKASCNLTFHVAFAISHLRFECVDQYLEVQKSSKWQTQHEMWDHMLFYDVRSLT